MPDSWDRLGAYRSVRDSEAASEFWAAAFARILERYPRDDGRRRTFAELERKTGGLVPRPYASDLFHGRIAEPGFSKIWALTVALGASLEEWSEGLAEAPPPRD